MSRRRGLMAQDKRIYLFKNGVINPLVGGFEQKGATKAVTSSTTATVGQTIDFHIPGGGTGGAQKIISLASINKLPEALYAGKTIHIKGSYTSSYEASKGQFCFGRSSTVTNAQTYDGAYGTNNSTYSYVYFNQYGDFEQTYTKTAPATGDWYLILFFDRWTSSGGNVSISEIWIE